MKRLLTIIVGFTMLCMSTASYAASDTVGTAYDESASALQQAGIVQGYEDGSIRPFGILSRAEAVKTAVLAREDWHSEVEWHRANVSPLPLFADTPIHTWYTPYLEVAVKHGIIAGYPDGYLRPDAPISTSEAVAMAVRTLQTPLQSQIRTSPYIENASDQWYTPFVNAVIEKNAVMHGQQLSLNAAMLRGQFFDMLYRLREVQIHKLTAYAGPEPSPGAIAPVFVADSRSQASGAFSISIPSLGISSLTVTHPSDPSTQKGVLKPLAVGVGHLFDYPGQGGKILIYGHSSGYPWDTSSYTKIFRTINKLAIGDQIYVAYNGKSYVYQVSKKKTVDAKDTSSFKPNGTEELILYTCWPPDSIAQRYLVFATPVQNVAQQ